MSGVLTLVPTPINDELKYNSTLIDHLTVAVEKENVIVVEEHKVARRKWIANGLPREAIDSFKCYNEHTREDLKMTLISLLKSGTDISLMSDCGLPAFCDPGRELIDLCHQHQIKVTALPFENSVALALALSGFDHHRFIFEGFIPRDDRNKHLKRIINQKETTIIMDTPYRLNKLIEELAGLNPKRLIFVAIDLNSENELLVRGSTKHIVKELNNINKREFVIVLGPND